MILLFNCNAQFEQYNNNRVLTNDNNFVSNNKLITLKLNALNDIVKADATLLNEPTTYAVGTAGLGSTSFYGGVLLPDGKVLLVPRNKGQCYVYDPVNDTTYAVGTAGLGNDAFMGGVLLSDGKALLVPRNKGQCYVYGSIFSKNFQLGTLLSRYLNKL